MSTYRCSDRTKVTKKEIDKRVWIAKKKKIEQFLYDNGFIFCEDCHDNMDRPVDCSHNISVKECQETGHAELAWDVNNITLRGRKYHQKHDKLNLKWKQ